MLSHRNQQDKLEHKTIPHFHLKISTFLCLLCKIIWSVFCPTCTWSSRSLCETQTILILPLKKSQWKPVHRFWRILTVKWVSIYGTTWSLIFKSYLYFQQLSNNYFLALHLLESNSLHLLLASSLPVIPEMSSKYHCDVGKESIYSAPELFLSFHPQPHS